MAGSLLALPVTPVMYKIIPPAVRKVWFYFPWENVISVRI